MKVRLRLCFRARKYSILELLEEMWNLEPQKCDKVRSTLAEKSRTRFLTRDMKFGSTLTSVKIGRNDHPTLHAISSYSDH